MKNEIKETIKNWKNINWNEYLSIEHIKFLLSDYNKDWGDFTSEVVDDGSKTAKQSRTQVIRFLLAKDEIQENKIKDLESKIKSLEERVSLNYKMLLKEGDE